MTKVLHLYYGMVYIIWLRPKKDIEAVCKFWSTFLLMMPYARDLNDTIIQ
jgi:hypothetical protein